jgi:conserved oligomeric Golgi complex subunit 6
MVQFYSETLCNVVGKDSVLATTMADLLEDAKTMFHDNLMSQSQDILRSVARPLPTLEPPPVLRECLTQLKEILVSYDMSLISESVRIDSVISSIYESYLEPMIHIINQSSQDLPLLESAIYKVNSFYSIQSSLSAFSFSDFKIEMLDELISREISLLIQEQCESMLSISGLKPLLEALKTLGRPLSNHAETSASAIGQRMKQLDQFLTGLTLDVSESLYRIQSLDIAKRVSQQGSLLFLNAYQNILKEIRDPANEVIFVDLVSRWYIITIGI